MHGGFCSGHSSAAGTVLLRESAEGCLGGVGVVAHSAAGNSGIEIVLFWLAVATIAISCLDEMRAECIWTRLVGVRNRRP